MPSVLPSASFPFRIESSTLPTLVGIILAATSGTRRGAPEEMLFCKIFRIGCCKRYVNRTAIQSSHHIVQRHLCDTIIPRPTTTGVFSVQQNALFTKGFCHGFSRCTCTSKGSPSDILMSPMVPNVQPGPPRNYFVSSAYVHCGDTVKYTQLPAVSFLV